MPDTNYHGQVHEMRLVGTLERRHGLAFILVQRTVRDLAVRELYVRRLHVRLVGERVLHPVLVITLQRVTLVGQLHAGHKNTDLREVLASVSTTRLLASRGRRDGLDGVLENVAELQGLDKITAQG
jgi:hypothetical protein